MSAPVAKPSAGPPSFAKKEKKQTAPRARAQWAPPPVGAQAVTTLPPPAPPAPPRKKTRRAKSGDTNTCLSREGNDRLTDCGRYVGESISVTDFEEEVTCTFCQWRIERGTAKVLH